MIDSLGLGGAQTLLTAVLPRLRALGVSCSVAALHGPGVLSQRLQASGIPIRHLARNRLDPRLPLLLGAEIRRGDYDIVHASLVPSSFLCEWLRRPFGIRRLIAHLHTPVAERLRFGYQGLLQRTMYRSPDLVVACSDQVAGSVSTTVPVEVIYNVVDPVRFAPASSDARRKARARFGVGADELCVISVGRLAPEKDHATLLAAVSEARTHGVPIRLLVAGSGNARSALSAHAEELGVGDCVRFLGFLPDVRPLFAAADCFALTSQFEGHPVGAVEALLAQVPLVSTDWPGVHELIRDGEEGLVVPGADATAFAAALTQVRDDPDAAAARAHAGREQALARFTPARGARRMRDVYAELAAC